MNWRDPFFRKYFAWMVIFISVFVALGLFAHKFLIDIVAQAQRTRWTSVTIAHLVDESNPDDPQKGIESFCQNESVCDSIEVSLLDEEGKVLYPPGLRVPPTARAALLRLAQPYDHTDLPLPFPPGGPNGPPPFDGPPTNAMGPPPNMGPPPSMGPPPGPRGTLPPHFEVVRLKANPPRFLFVHERPGPFGPRPLTAALAGLAFLVVSVALGIGFALTAIYRSVGRRALDAEKVIDQLRHGDLASRFKITNQNVFSPLMRGFNKMADEIEVLVKNLRESEASRIKILQELAHDLKTPIAALKSLLETLAHASPELANQLRPEVLSLSLSEVDYFARLVEDLLFLSQMNDPHYRTDARSIPLSPLIREVIDDLNLRLANEKTGKSVEFAALADLSMIGDPHLIRRALRNALENAVSFCQERVLVTLRKEGSEHFSIIIEDDGPGFSQQALAEFGKRRLSRQTQNSGGSQIRVSNGLGSVIIKRIIELHRGEVQIENIPSAAGKNAGARLSLGLPMT